MFLLLAVRGLGQESDTVVLNEIEIKSSRIAITDDQNLRSVQILDKELVNSASSNDIGTILKENSLVDIRQRSFSDVQSDVSIRGGSFDQNLVLLNGINLSDPQTGHHTLNIPFSAMAIEGVEVVYGPASGIFGPNALTGAVNIISAIPQNSSLNLDFSYGSFNTIKTGLGLNHITRKIKHAFFVDYASSDGFAENTDYDKSNIYYESNVDLKTVKLKLMAGFMAKEFGSNSFYTPMYPAQYEKIRTGFVAAKLSGGELIKWDYNLYYRGLKDQFQLFREGVDYYENNNGVWINSSIGDTISWYSRHNDHFTNVYGSGLNLAKDWKLGKTALGADYRNEQILSNVLGLDIENSTGDLYTKSDIRENISLFMQHAYFSEKFLANIGAMGYWNQNYDWNFYWGGDFGYKITKKIMIKTGLNKSLRLPTFTELYYNGPSNVGNPDLMPESAISADMGFRYILNNKSYISFNVFNRFGENIISWVKDIDAAKWETANLTKLDTRGVELNAVYGDFKSEFPVKRLWVSYSYLMQDKSVSGLESKYTLDQLKHKMIAGVKHKIYKNISAVWTVNMFQRNGEYLYFDRELNSYTDSHTYDLTVLFNGKVEAKFKVFSVYVGLNNITNTDYFDIANVPTPGFSVNGGVKVNLKGNK